MPFRLTKRIIKEEIVNTVINRHKLPAVPIGLIAFLFLIMVTKAFAANEYDLTLPGASVKINGAIFQALTSSDPSGSGAFNSFVRIDSKSLVIKGYNTDFRPLQFDEKSSPSFTRSLLLSDIPPIWEENTIYRAFDLDINQKGRKSEAYLTVDEIELYETPYADLCGYPFDGSGGGQTGCSTNNTATLIWDMDAFGDSFVLLDSRNGPGSGKREMRLLVPDSLFNQNPNCNFGSFGYEILSQHLFEIF